MSLPLCTQSPALRAPRRLAPSLAAAPPAEPSKQVVERLTEISPPFGELYGGLFARACINVAHLHQLTREDLLAIGVPVGHALDIMNGAVQKTKRRPLGKSSYVPAPGDPAHAGDAYGEYAVVSALVFGFAVSTFAATPSMLADLEAPTSGIIGSFLLLLSGVTLLSGFSTVTTALQRYYCKLLLARTPDALQRFIEQTHFISVQARRATWLALSLYLVSLAVLAFEIFNRYEASAAVWRLGLIVSVLAIGAILVLATYRMLSRAYERAVSRIGGYEAMSRARLSRRNLVYPADHERVVAAGANVDESPGARSAPAAQTRYAVSIAEP